MEIIAKPFDLEAALRGEPIIDNMGNKFLEIMHSSIAKEKGYFISLAAFREDGHLFSFNKEGVCATNPGCYLLMAPKIKTYYISIYKQDNERYSGFIHSTEEEALILSKQHGHYIKTISFEIGELE